MTDGTDGPDPRYWRYDRIVAQFEAWRRESPDTVRIESIGRTRLGEPILAARIARVAAGSRPRPAVLIHAAQHANEANGTGAVMALARRLIDDRDDALASIVDGVETWLVPVVNVDGHRRVFSGAPGWEDWRKNARDNDGDGTFTDTDGVDLNRNWDHRWEEDPSARPESRNYKGPRPFSEPEVVALRDLVLRERPVVVVDLHSPGKITRPNVIFWPWYVRETKSLGPDAAAYRAVAHDLAAATLTEEDGVFYDGRFPSYDTLPKEQCWAYRETGLCVLLMEISTRFWWDGPIVDRIAERVAEGLTVVLERARTGPGLAARVRDADTDAPVAAEVRVTDAHDPAIGPRLARARDGTAWRLLEPGPVRVEIRARGHAPAVRRVVIRDEGWTRLDLRLGVGDRSR